MHRKRKVIIHKDRDRSHVEDNLNKYMKTSPPSRKHYDLSRQVTLLIEMIQAFLSYHHCRFLQLFAQRRKVCHACFNGLLTFARNTAHFSRSLSERYRDVGLYIAGSFYWIILQVFSWHCFQKAFASNLSTVYSCVLTLSRVIKQYDIFILLPYRP